MRKIGSLLKEMLFLTVLLCAFVPVAFATPALPVDRDEFSIGDAITAEISAYGVKSTHTGYKENEKEAKIFYTRKGTADQTQPLRFILTAKQAVQGASQEVEFTAQPYAEMNRYAGQKLEKFHRKVQGSAGKRLNVNFEYKLPPKSRLLVATVQLKDYHKKGNQVLPRYTTVEYELNVVGYVEANADPLRGKNVKTVRDSKGKRMIIEKKGTDAAVAAVGIGGSLIAALGCWFIHKRKKK
jgi:hypothetical protein